MSGQRIYYAPPRLVGSLRRWSGMDTPAGNSWLIDHAVDLGFNAIWFSPFLQTTAAEKNAHGQKATGSYYAIRDHFMVDPEFSSSGFTTHADLTEAERERIAQMDAKHLKHFCRQAAEKGVRVYADLVFNHVAADHPLVIAEKREIDDILSRTGGKYSFLRADKKDPKCEGKIIGLEYEEGGQKKEFLFTFRRRTDLTLEIGGPAEDPWSDVAQVNFSSPKGRQVFVEGDGATPGLFKQVLDWHLERGFTGFRCDAAYKIPPESWQELIAYARAKQPDVIFLAETLCTDTPKVERMSKAKITDAQGRERPAFDLGMLGIYWWDFVAGWMKNDEIPRINNMSKFGGAGAPDNQDTENTLAGGFARAAMAKPAIAAICVRDYAVSTLACASVFMQMGYEYGNEKQNSVFKGGVSPADWKALSEKPHFDISSRIRAINHLKRGLNADNCRVGLKEVKEDNGLIRIHAEYIDVDTHKKTAEIVLLLNAKPEAGPLPLPANVPGVDGLQKLEDVKQVADVVVYHTPVKDDLKIQPAAKAQPKRYNF